MLHKSKLCSRAKDMGIFKASIDDTVLATIINAKLEEISEPVPKRMRSRPIYDFKQALSHNSCNFVMEMKRSSPSLGDFCKNFKPQKIFTVYKNFASAISILCEKTYFKGDLNLGVEIGAKCDLPLLCKDFIFCKEQIDRAYDYGFDAILLMLSVLEHQVFLDLLAYAKQKGLYVLAEVSNESEAYFAADIEAIDVIGINNRNLKTLDIDLNNTLQIYPILKNKVVLSESGFTNHSDLSKVYPICNYLIGSALTASPNLENTCKEMVYGLNKVCGITTKDAIDYIDPNFISLIGFIFCSQSPRFVDPQKAKPLITHAKNRKFQCVGVFKDNSVDEIINIANELKLDFIQIHGNVTKDMLCELKNIIDAQIITVLNTDSLNCDALNKKACEYLKYCTYFLLDNKIPGSGKSLDLKNLDGFLYKDRTLLAGGIGPDNLEPLLHLGFLGFDLNSKLESSVGIKDPKKINQISNIFAKLGR